MAIGDLERAYEIVRSLNSQERHQLLFMTSMINEGDAESLESWTDEELREVMKPNPMSGKDLVESGLLGGGNIRVLKTA